MFTSNPFAELSASIPPAFIQTYIVIMILLVAGGTLFDIFHKKSAKYFFNDWRKTKSNATRQVGGGEMASLAVRTAVVEGLMSGEFCNARRRIAHLLTMYGFVAYVVTTVIMVFWYPTPATPAPAILPALWNIGALMVLAGGYWFWFFLLVDVAAEGKSPFRLMRAATRPMMKARGGRIVSITSVVGHTGNPGQMNYVAAKAGLTGMSKSLAQELASRNITVNCVAPGFIRTAMTDALNDEQKAAINGRIPMGRMGEGDEIGAAVAYLASDEAAYVTGQTLHVNGGMAMMG